MTFSGGGTTPPPCSFPLHSSSAGGKMPNLDMTTSLLPYLSSSSRTTSTDQHNQLYVSAMDPNSEGSSTTVPKFMNGQMSAKDSQTTSEVRSTEAGFTKGQPRPLAAKLKSSLSLERTELLGAAVKRRLKAMRSLDTTVKPESSSAKTKGSLKQRLEPKSSLGGLETRLAINQARASTLPSFQTSDDGGRKSDEGIVTKNQVIHEEVIEVDSFRPAVDGEGPSKTKTKTIIARISSL